ncbi:MAG: GNAT family N-acetyltransferase [Solirubrobacterales bacterium]|nr:GNAT family N-acetyltransferase [Solirubrobacterales bacterium]
MTAATERDAPRVLGLSPDWLGESAALLAASFADDPVYRAVFARAADPRRELQRFMASPLRDALDAGVAHGALVAGRLAGVAAWLPPGAYPWSAARKARAAPRLLGIWLGAPGSARMLARLGSNVEAAFPRDEPLSYLEVIGVDPAFQGRGVGSVLIREGLRLADAAGHACYLETPVASNVRLYERFGFEVERDGLELLPGGPTHWTMRRPHGLTEPAASIGVS